MPRSKSRKKVAKKIAKKEPKKMTKKKLTKSKTKKKSKVGRVKTCGKCGKAGFNARSCKRNGGKGHKA